jgi:hypothetical protein
LRKHPFALILIACLLALALGLSLLVETPKSTHSVFDLNLLGFTFATKKANDGDEIAQRKIAMYWLTKGYIGCAKSVMLLKPLSESAFAQSWLIDERFKLTSAANADECKYGLFGPITKQTLS